MFAVCARNPRKAAKRRGCGEARDHDGTRSDFRPHREVPQGTARPSADEIRYTMKRPLALKLGERRALARISRLAGGKTAGRGDAPFLRLGDRISCSTRRALARPGLRSPWSSRTRPARRSSGRVASRRAGERVRTAEPPSRRFSAGRERFDPPRGRRSDVRTRASLAPIRRPRRCSTATGSQSPATPNPRPPCQSAPAELRAPSDAMVGGTSGGAG